MCTKLILNAALRSTQKPQNRDCRAPRVEIDHRDTGEERLLADTRMKTWLPAGQLRKTAASIVSSVTYSKALVRARLSSARAVKTAARTSSVKKKHQVADAPFTPSLINNHTAVYQKWLLRRKLPETFVVVQAF